MFSDVMDYRRQGSVSRRFLHHCVLPFFLLLKIYLFIIWSSEIHKDIQVTRSDEEVDVLLTKRCT